MALPAFSQFQMETSRQEVSAQVLGSFVKSTTQDGIENKATHSGGVLGSYRYFFNMHHGVEANYGYSLNTQSYGLHSGVVGVKTYSHEVSGAYVFRYPLGKFTPFGLAGAGALIFDPKDFIGAETQNTRRIHLWRRGRLHALTARLYAGRYIRALSTIHRHNNVPGLSGTDRVTHRAEPSIGLGYRF